MINELRAAIQEVMSELSLEVGDFSIEHPADLEHGDYASNVAMVAAKAAGENPRELAEEITEKLTGKIEQMEKIEVAGPGFINFYLARDFFTAEIENIIKSGSNWGRNKDWDGEVVAVEYTSPNLFKPLHVGNLVGNIIGESIARLFEFSGASVARFNYPSDIGLTVAKGVWGLKQTGGNPADITALGEAYRVGNEAYEKEGPEAEEIKEINKALYENTDPELTALREQGIKTSKARLQELLDVLGTSFDHEISESMVSEPGLKIVKEHVGTVFTESDGAVIYEGEKAGLHTRVFINSKGLPTYEAKDIGHFKLKDAAEPDWKHSIIVTGNEQAEYFKVVFAALQEIFPTLEADSLEHIPTGFLTLTTGKMSSRTGNVLTGESLLEDMQAAARARAEESRTNDLEELTEQVAVAALKYQILKHSVGSNIVFDKEKALSFEGDSGPYLQYTYARINSVIDKAADAGVTPDVTNVPDAPYAIEKILYRFPEVIEKARNERAPHQVITYVTELASAFNTLYANEKIADAGDEYAPYKTAIAKATAATLKNGLWILGIKAPERM